MVVTKPQSKAVFFFATLAGLLVTTGCPTRPRRAEPVNAISLRNAIGQVDISAPMHPEFTAEPIHLSTARNSFASFELRLDGTQLPTHPVLRVHPFAFSAVHGPAHDEDRVVMSAFQVLNSRVDLDDAAYVRQTGQPGTAMSVPRVLLPLPIANGLVDLSAVHDPANPAKVGPALGQATVGAAVGGPAGDSIVIWFDVHVLADTPAGEYTSRCDLLDSHASQTTGEMPVRLSVENLTLPSESHLHFAAPLDWDTLVSSHSALFQGITPRLLNRSDPGRIAVLRKIDSYLQLAHENRADFYVPRLQPVVKWPLGKSPQADWSDFDSVVAPWLNGHAFSDRQPIAFWPLPAPDSLAGFDLATQVQYWQLAANHFEQALWLEQSPVVLTTEMPESVNEAESLLLSAQARQILATNPRVTTMLPLHDDQTELASDANPNAISAGTTTRLITLSQGLVYPSAIRQWPANALPPRHWIDAGAKDGSCDITGIATEQGIRTLASLAFSRDASVILCGKPLPAPGRPSTRADQLLWCYPGEEFGVEFPLATVQLKWIRQAEQDYEYMVLASQQKDYNTSMKMSQLISKPVQLSPGQQDQPIFNLLAGNTDPRASEEARQLLVSRMSSAYTSSPGGDAGDPLQLQTLRWFSARQRPTMAATSVDWLWDLQPTKFVPETGNWIDARINLAIYNPSEEMPAGNVLDWTQIPGGWESHPAPTEVPALAQYQVRQVTAHARFNLDQASPDSCGPAQISFVEGFSGQMIPCKFRLPVAVSERRDHPLDIDGQLNDWFPADAIQLEEPLIRMLNRTALQSGDLEPAPTPASVYTAWSDDNFYLAFRLGGVDSIDLRSTRNFVKYDHGRAWGEDLCEVLIQPIYTDNTLGPTLHVVCKPGGNWVERQISTTPGSVVKQPWLDFEASGLRYASGVDPAKKVWRGEVAIPWKALATTGHGRPHLLRFNFIQHQHSTALSSSWAGPIDDSRDGGLAGLLLLKEP